MPPKKRLRETDLYPALHDFLVAQGYTVRSEVNHCDLTAVKDDELVIIEIKTRFNIPLLVQATDRQKIADSVYVAVPFEEAMRSRAQWRGVRHLLRRLELGLLLVKPKSRVRKVEIALDPAPSKRRRSHVNRRALLHEINGRSGDYNTAGSTRKKLMTAYRESAIFIACCLEKYGPLSPRQLRTLGTGPKTTPILYDNVYGWFDHIDKGLYGLNKKALKGMEEFTDVTAQYRQTVQELPQP